MTVAGKNNIGVNIIPCVCSLINSVEHYEVGKIFFEISAAVFCFDYVVGITSDFMHFILQRRVGKIPEKSKRIPGVDSGNLLVGCSGRRG